MPRSPAKPVKVQIPGRLRSRLYGAIAQKQLRERCRVTASSYVAAALEAALLADEAQWNGGVQYRGRGTLAGRPRVWFKSTEGE